MKAQTTWVNIKSFSTFQARVGSPSSSKGPKIFRVHCAGTSQGPFYIRTSARPGGGIFVSQLLPGVKALTDENPSAIGSTGVCYARYVLSTCSSRFEQRKVNPGPHQIINYLGDITTTKISPPLNITTITTTYLQQSREPIDCDNHPRNQRSHRRLSEGQDTLTSLILLPLFFPLSLPLPLQDAFENSKAGAESGCGYSCPVRLLQHEVLHFPVHFNCLSLS